MHTTKPLVTIILYLIGLELADGQSASPIIIRKDMTVISTFSDKPIAINFVFVFTYKLVLKRKSIDCIE